MQTFLPHDSYWESAKALDSRRLNNQANEAVVILKTLLGMYESKESGRPGGWPHHPATKMWKGYEYDLCNYGIVVCQVCVQRGIDRRDTAEWFEQTQKSLVPCGTPTWMGRFSFHESHRSNLIRKDPTYYGPKWPNTPDDLPYVWPALERA